VRNTHRLASDFSERNHEFPLNSSNPRPPYTQARKSKKPCPSPFSFCAPSREAKNAQRNQRLNPAAMAKLKTNTIIEEIKRKHLALRLAGPPRRLQFPADCRGFGRKPAARLKLV
jgi:hypothetical protein